MGRCSFLLFLLHFVLHMFLHAQEAPLEPELTHLETQKEVEQWLKFGKPERFRHIPEKEKKYAGPPLKITLSDVVSSTLKNQWNVQIAIKDVDKQCGLALAARGPFDPTLGGAVKSTWMQDTQVFGFKTGKSGDIDTARVFVEKLLRLGTRFSLEGKVERVHNPSLLFSNPYNRTNATTLTFAIDQPLLRRFKYNAQSVDEIVNDLEVKALQDELIQNMALNVRDALFEYWDLVAAKKVVAINEKAEMILDGLASATEKLVEGEKVSASELNEQFAELARSNRETIASEQKVFRVFNRLLFGMGTTRSDFPQEAPKLQLEEFPDFKTDKRDWDYEHLLSIAVQNRGDLLAAKTRIDEADWQLRLARQELYPSLDLRLGYDFFNSEINEKSKPFFSSTEEHLAQKNYSAELNLSFPLCFDKARGEKRRRMDERAQACLEESKLYENILTDVAIAYRNQIELLDEIYYAKETVEWYEKALHDEILRYKEGYGSLFIVIDFENRLRRALIEQVDVAANLAKNIVRLLFLTGTLVQKDPCCNQVCVETLNYEKLLKR